MCAASPTDVPPNFITIIESAVPGVRKGAAIIEARRETVEERARAPSDGKRLPATIARMRLVLGLVVATLAFGCSGRGGSRFALGGVRGGSGKVLVTARLVDAETGAAVSRRSVWVHGFNDATKFQASLEPEDETTFELRLPDPEIRLRVVDATHQYELFQKNFVATHDALDLDVRLVPTHWIRLHGHVLWRDGTKLRTVPANRGQMGGTPMVSVGPADLDYDDDDGTYSVRVPRKLLKLTTLDTNRHAVPSELDLTGATDDDRSFDVVLEE
jgi:hypothetical protein